MASFGTPASAYWGSTGSAAATAMTGTLNAPIAVAAEQPDPLAATARVHWAPAASPSVAPTGYYVERTDGDTVSPACGTSADHPIDTTTCLDRDLQAGRTYTWVVTALYRSWTATSAPSTPLTITSVVPLVVSGVVPGVGQVAGGTAITVSGSGFVAGSLVLVGGRPATSVSVVDAGTITAVTPPGRVGAVDVTVVKPDGTSATLAGGFTYQAAPVVRRVTPREGPASGGTLVTITGRDFGAGAAVWFGDAQASSVVVVDSRTVTAVSPAHVPGTVTVAVTTAGGTGTLRNAFSYRPTARTTLDPTTPATTTKAESPADAPVTVSTTATDSGQADPQETAPLIPNPSAGSSASAILSPSPAATPSSSPSPEEFEGSEAPTARLKPDPVPSATT